MKKLTDIVIVSIILTFAITTWAGEEALPKDLDSYTYTGSLVIPDKNSPLFGFFHYYINNKGLTAFKKGGPYPEGTIIVGKVYDVVTSLVGGMIEGKILRYSLHEEGHVCERNRRLDICRLLFGAEVHPEGRKDRLFRLPHGGQGLRLRVFETAGISDCNRSSEKTVLEVKGFRLDYFCHGVLSIRMLITKA
jgi:hypothetical protein